MHETEGLETHSPNAEPVLLAGLVPFPFYFSSDRESLSRATIMHYSENYRRSPVI